VRCIIHATGLLTAVLLVLALPLWAAETTNISGTILALVTVQVRHEGPRLTALKVVVSTVVAP
jgi:hypothetical protein